MQAQRPQAPPIAELVLEFVAPRLHTVGDKPCAAGTLTLKYKPVGGGRGIDGVATDFISPLGPDDAEDLRWYIEDYCRWPWGVFRNRAQSIEAKIPQWGRMLYDSIAESTRNARAIAEFIRDKAFDGSRTDKRITVYVDHRDTENTDAAALLFGLPWELLHDEDSYLFDGAVKARVRRTLPSETVREQVQPRQHVRVLHVRARPEDDRAKFIDPRSSALPLVETLHELGDQVKLDILSDSTFDALQKALTDAEDEGDPYQVVHFDGHGVYDKVRGLGLLCFEDAEDARSGREKRRSHNVPAREIGALLRDRRVPLFVLDACQTAMAETNVDTSVAAELLRQGVVSVVAMRYAVLLSTAKRFVEAFYGALAKGHRIGRAMVEAQHALKSAPMRSDFGSRGRLELQDWMIPVLFQEGDDPQIFVGGVDASPQAIESRKQDDAFRHGELPKKPPHGFVGRARDLLRIERRITRQRRVAIVGAGGEGKTALAVEAAHWFLLTKQRERVAFVSVERLSDARAVLDAVGRQLVPGYSMAMVEAGGSDPIRPVKSALLKERTLLVVDNFESLIALADKDPTNAETVRDIVNLVHELADVTGTWLITTSRESLPGSSDNEEMRIHSLEPPDARELLAKVLREKCIEPPYEPKAAEELEQAITSLIAAVRGHARSLVLLGPNIAGRGIEATRDAIHHEMVALEKRYPGDRERSLLASVRVSLGMLDPATRKMIAPLSVFRRAAPLMLLPFVLEVEPHEIIEASEKLVELGLAQMNGPYLLPDPALGEALALEMDPPARQAAETRWCRGMHSFAHFMSEQQGQNARIARHGTAVALIDLLDALEITVRGVQAGTVSADVGAIFATCLEYLVTMIGHPRAAARTISAREMLASMLPEWSHTRFMTDAAEIDRCLDAGNMDRAFKLALRLRDNANAAADAYPDAAYDRAEAMCRLGDVLQRMGRAQEAMPILFAVLSQVRHLKMNGSTQASMLEGLVHTKLGDALYKIGKLDHAAAMYEEAVRLDRARGDIRSIVVGLGQLAHVRFLQRRFDDALKAYSDVRGRFEQIGEPAGIATANYNIANIYTQLGDYHRAELAHKESLRIKVALGDQWGEAASLGELGTLYFVQEREQEAVTLYRQAMALYEELGDVGGVARQATNLGRALQELRRFDEAREVLLIATNLDAKLGEIAERWKAWAILSAVERNAGRTDAATHARVCTMKAYCDYRRAGGEAVDLQARFAQDVCEALQHGGQDAVAELLQDLRTMDSEQTPDRLALLKVLEQVLAGNRSIDLTNDPSLDPIAAAELQFQLEVFSGEG